jgi:hypothetical protein
MIECKESFNKGKWTFNCNLIPIKKLLLFSAYGHTKEEEEILILFYKKVNTNISQIPWRFY